MIFIFCRFAVTNQSKLVENGIIAVDTFSSGHSHTHTKNAMFLFAVPYFAFAAAGRQRQQSLHAIKVCSVGKLASFLPQEPLNTRTVDFCRFFENHLAIKILPFRRKYHSSRIM
jgi:hypothetical protein